MRRPSCTFNHRRLLATVTGLLLLCGPPKIEGANPQGTVPTKQGSVSDQALERAHGVLLVVQRLASAFELEVDKDERERRLVDAHAAVEDFDNSPAGKELQLFTATLRQAVLEYRLAEKTKGDERRAIAASAREKLTRARELLATHHATGKDESSLTEESHATVAQTHSTAPEGMVLLHVTVTDPHNRLITGLSRDSFQVYEEGREQEVEYYDATPNKDTPWSIGFVADVSSSMKGKRGAVFAAIRASVGAAPVGSDFFVLGFNQDFNLLRCGSPCSMDDIESQYMELPVKGGSKLLDAAWIALEEVQKLKNRKRALVILSDGGSQGSSHTDREVKERIRSADAQVYAIGIFDPVGQRGQPELVWGMSLLGELAEMTGGRMFPVEIYNIQELPGVAQKISIELRNQYVIGYHPTNQQDGSWRKIRVRVNPPKGLPLLTTYVRSGYYALPR